MGRVTSGKFGDSGRRKVKRKSVKSKATGRAMNSKRRTQRMGKEQKKGHRGIAASYITRNQAIRRLQVTLRDFRRLCILRGIFPRDPKKKASGSNKTYYHVKDVMYLQHEPLLHKFREFKAFMKKVRRQAGRKNIQRAQDLWNSRPTYTLHHIVKDRYPTFDEALADVNDALCMAHLFASLPAMGQIKAERGQLCSKLCREWQNYCVATKSLRKVFCSIKGVYFEADVQGHNITWIEPYKFSQDRPSDVDFRVMLTFLEFYEVFMQFIMFKLYSDAGLQYPPKFDEEADAAGAHLGSMEVIQSGKNELKAVEVVESEEESEVEELNEEGEAEIVSRVTEKVSTFTEKNNLSEADKNRFKSLPAKIQEIAKKGSNGVNITIPEEKTKVEELEEAFSGSLEAVEVHRKQKEMHTLTNLFKGLRFFLGREIPREVTEFAIRSFSGECGWHGLASPFDINDKSITHMIVDRPSIQGEKNPAREYVQPQWIFDSINARMLLPVEKYLHGVELPPHLSPFVDDAKEGYVPAYRGVVQSLQVSAGVIKAEDALRVDSASKIIVEDNEDEATILAKSMMSKKAKRLHSRMIHGHKKKNDANEMLENKRRKLNKKKKKKA